MGKIINNSFSSPTKSSIRFGLTLTALLVSTMSLGQTVTETQQSIHQLDHKIHVLQTHLSHTHDQQDKLHKELLETERLIKENTTKLALIQQQLPLKQADIARLKQEIADLDQEFKRLQQALVLQITARYKRPANQPLGWVLNHQQRAHADKLLAYYQYVIRASEHTLDHLKHTQTTLSTQQEHLQQELASLSQMQAQWQSQQQQLQQHQQQHKTLLHALTHHIQTEEKTLTTYQRNRDNLSRILHTLNQQSVIQTRHSMTKMKRKLPLPVIVEAEHIQKLNQGIMLYGTEGSSVHAVYPGKVVFCEWLNGYGLLMIIDHGWGLMTLYANNHTLIKHKGDTVNQGEIIATVGHGGVSNQTGLYFEVRKQGKAISPMDWLSKVRLAKK
ncbi:MAG: peptidase M24 [Legionella sp.]|nr:MAG: peptidase M24 [Legionella sp.]